MLKHAVALVAGIVAWGVDLQYWQFMLVGLGIALAYLAFMYWVIHHVMGPLK
ncbi:MAG: hypothetical protein V3S55_10085 [Nitrospiraceae bacterium]